MMKKQQMRWLGQPSRHLRKSPPPSTHLPPHPSSLHNEDEEIHTCDCAEIIAELSNRLREIEKKLHLEQQYSREISTENVNEFVNQLLQNEASNFGWLPDSIEKRLDRRIILLALGALTEALKTASIEVAGARLEFSISPLEVRGEGGDAIHQEKQGNVINFDTIIKDVLQQLLGSAQVNMLGHRINFHLK